MGSLDSLVLIFKIIFFLPILILGLILLKTKVFSGFQFFIFVGTGIFSLIFGLELIGWSGWSWWFGWFLEKISEPFQFYVIILIPIFVSFSSVGFFSLLIYILTEIRRGAFGKLFLHEYGENNAGVLIVGEEATTKKFSLKRVLLFSLFFVLLVCVYVDIKVTPHRECLSYSASPYRGDPNWPEEYVRCMQKKNLLK